ncbi:MAG TPA: outer membrane lipoprotein-sorting protein [Vicinamibacterales bacterium]|nr:outer membrane lipoprotein-sorting protein [Vicinamibacterales bacterium]
MNDLRLVACGMAAAAVLCVPAGADQARGGAAAGAPLSGREIAERVDGRSTGRDQRMTMDVVLIDASGGRRQRGLSFLRRTEAGHDQTVVSFTYPPDIQGTALLVLEQPRTRGEWFLYLPAIGRSRRIASAERHDRFAGTDFSYEDIAGSPLDDFEYVFLHEEPVDDRAALVIEARPVEPSFYERQIRWVDRERSIVVRAEYYRQGEVAKRYRATAAARTDGIWTMRRLEMDDLRARHKTIIDVTDVKYNVGLDPQQFTRRALERR